MNFAIRANSTKITQLWEKPFLNWWNYCVRGDSGNFFLLLLPSYFVRVKHFKWQNEIVLLFLLSWLCGLRDTTTNCNFLFTYSGKKYVYNQESKRLFQSVITIVFFVIHFASAFYINKVSRRKSMLPFYCTYEQKHDAHM